MNHLRRVLALLMTFAMLLSCVGVIHAEEHDCPSKDFIDAPAEGTWAHEGVDYMIANGIMNGTSETPKTFSPKTPTNRAMIVQILYRLEGQPEVSGELQFNDVTKGRWYYNAILWAVQNGVTKGVSDTKFNPDGYVTREQIAAFLYRFEAPEEAPDPAVLAGFPDSQAVSNYAKEAMSWAVGKGIINGKGRNGESYLDPKANANRDEVATMIYRYLSLEPAPDPVPESIDFTDPADAEKYEIRSKVNAAPVEGVGVALVTSRPAFETCNGQNSGDQATNPEDVVSVPVSGNWIATLQVDFE